MNRAPHIVIVDDEPNVRLVFRTALESVGYTLSYAENGESALKALERGAVDLMLLDLQMPIMGGMDVLKRLRDTGHHLPVVIVTAHGSVANAVEAMKLGAIDFLTKPLSPETLRRIVADVLKRHTPDRFEPASPAPALAAETAVDPFTDNLTRAKRALNLCEFEEAEALLRQSLALNPESSDAHNLLGVLHEMRNKFEDSYREYKAALKSNSHYVPAQHNMRRYYERFRFGASDVPIDLGDNT
jgi:DNA-binding response OmpR family regulator